MAFPLRQVGGGGNQQFRVRGGIGPRLRIATNTSALVFGGGVAGRAFIGGSRIGRIGGVSTLTSLISQTGSSFTGSVIVSGGSIPRGILLAE